MKSSKKKNLKNKYFVCSDIHGFYDEWMEALDNSGFDIENKDHHIILCGDLLDRGRQPKECLLFVNKLLKQGRIICIMGNHELLLNAAIKNGYLDDTDVHNGTMKTVSDLVGRDKNREDKNGNYISDEDALKIISEYSPWNNYYKSCKLYYETDNYIFVHSWVSDKDNWRDTNNLVNLREWVEYAVWYNPFTRWEINNKQGIDGKTVVFGHWHTSWAYKHYRGYDKEFLSMVETTYYDSEGVLHPTVCHDIFIDKGIIALDACTTNSKKVNILVLEGDEL